MSQEMLEAFRILEEENTLTKMILLMRLKNH